MEVLRVPAQINSKGTSSSGSSAANFEFLLQKQHHGWQQLMAEESQILGIQCSVGAADVVFPQAKSGI